MQEQDYNRHIVQFRNEKKNKKVEDYLQYLQYASQYHHAKVFAEWFWETLFVLVLSGIVFLRYVIASARPNLERIRKLIF